jgi:hypothetical protein
MIYFQVPFAVGYSEAFTEELASSPIFAPLIRSFEEGNLAFAIAYTFLVNTVSGAFTSTTLPGMIPLIGAGILGGITAIRGIIVGMIYYYAFTVSIGYMIVALGTAILELGAYVFSAAAGINISLAPIFPQRYAVENRWTAFKLAWKDAARLYVIVLILLALGAIWEMTGIFLHLPNS